jgi:hypothetical protein
VAAELATEAETKADGERIDALLSQVKQAVDASATNDAELLAITAQPPADDTQAKAALLERAIVALETSAGRQPPELEAARNEIYAYLREVAGRGWSFWDMLSFRKAPS